MKSYTPPQLTEYGDIADITAVAGGAWIGDVLVDVNGDVIMNGNQSLDACPTQNPVPGGSCEINP